MNGNISLDPVFTADYHLDDASPCLDRGPDPATYNGTPAGDLDGNPRLRDHNGDGLAETDMGVYEAENTTLDPGDVTGVRWNDTSIMTWDLQTGTTETNEYGVYRGDLATLGYDDFGCLRDDLNGSRLDLFMSDPEVPVLGTGFFYLVTGVFLPAEGTLGIGTFAERSNFGPCP